MNETADRLARKVEVELGGSDISWDAEVALAHAVDGQRPAVVCWPGSPQEVATLLRLAAAEKAAVSPWGGGTAMTLGNRARDVCIVANLTHMNRLIEHDPANLTVTAQSGITIAGLQTQLARHRQCLPFDAPFPERATLGGTVAANANGPRRSYYGSIRDLVIGMKAALVTGESIKAGGKVVKNVAGYDMCKLFVGSLGTLGVITEATVKVQPLPENAATMTVSGDLANTLRCFDALSRLPLLPAAAVVTNIEAPHGADKEWRLALWCEGFEESVARQLSELETLARHTGLVTTILRDDDHTRLWDGIRNFPFNSERCTYRATVPRAAAGVFVDAAAGITAEPPAVAGDVAAGTIWLSWPASRQAAAAWPRLASLATTKGGHAVMYSAPHGLKEGLDVWGVAPASFGLMRKLKREFDPQGLLNPGRFLAGI